MFFSKPGQYEPCGMYSAGHIFILSVTVIFVALALYFTKSFDKDKVKKTIRRCTISLWVLEIVKIVFNLLVGNASNPNNYIPLYYCSLILFAGIFSSFTKGKLKKIGDVFIATGAIIGGLFFLFSPNTSLPAYQLFHYISIQSFVFHGTMLYLGLLVNITGYVDLKMGDIGYYAILLSIISVIALVVNKILGTNFMFISNNFPKTPIAILYENTGKLFTPIMIGIQATGPFLVVYGLRNLFTKKKSLA